MQSMTPRSFLWARARTGIALILLAFPSAVALAQTETPPTPIFPDIAPICSIDSLTNLTLPNTTIDSAVLNADDDSCRITATVTHPPSGDQVRIFIALPIKGWNGRFQGTGGAGMAGGFSFSLGGPLRLGYATGATDTGHQGMSGSFALDASGRLNWQSIEDNAYLGIHDMTVVGKALTKAFYGRAPRYSYFVGFSTGGRQGLMEAQRYPDDYDGIISGCPAINWQRFVLAELWPQVVMRAGSNFVSRAKLQAATAAAIASCGGQQGADNRVIQDPSRCTFDPGALVGTQVGDSTFTAADADVIRKIWAGPRAQDGGFIWYGLSRGADLTALAGRTPFPIAMDYVRYFLVQDPKWSAASLTPDEYYFLMRQSVEEYGDVIGTDNPDLSRFRDHGGKIIITHGQADQLIMTQGTVDYYSRVCQQMGGQKKVMQFARLFLIPGAGHGTGGVMYDQDAIIRWVEKGVAPDKLIAREQGGSQALFPYPELAQYKGSGSADDAANFVPVLPRD
jgi:pimeloyl-ACP methyl ester carboxylesterase